MACLVVPGVVRSVLDFGMCGILQRDNYKTAPQPTVAFSQLCGHPAQGIEDRPEPG